MTIRDVAKSIGISPSTLSQVENGKISPSLKTLALLSEFFCLRPTDLFESYGVSVEEQVLKKQRRRIWQDKDNKVFYELLNHNLYNVRIEVLKLTIAKNGFVPAHAAAQGEEFCLILKGKVEFTLGKDVFIMEESDTLQYDASVRHEVKNVSDLESEILWISTPPNF